MDDLAGMLSQVLNDPQSMQQIQQVAASLGLGGSAAENTQEAAPAQGSGVDLSALSSLLGGANTQQAAQGAAAGTGQGGGVDTAALSSLLSGLSGGAQAPASAQQETPDLSALLSGLAGGAQGGSGGGQTAAPNVDLSALSGLLGGLTGGAQSSPAGGQGGTSGVDLSGLSGLLGGLAGGAQSPAPAGGADVSALTALLRAGQPQQAQTQTGGLPFDMSTLLKLQSAMSSLAENRANVELLLALKPRLKEQRAKKVDDAIKVMQLIQFLPLIKETGLFGGLDNGLGGLLGNMNGGLGGIVGGLGDGLSGALGNLLGGGRR